MVMLAKQRVWRNAPSNTSHRGAVVLLASCGAAQAAHVVRTLEDAAFCGELFGALRGCLTFGLENPIFQLTKKTRPRDATLYAYAIDA